ncbi:hypothetical protein LXL04_019638 [Taraxacum kok-saghyz]
MFHFSAFGSFLPGIPVSGGGQGALDWAASCVQLGSCCCEKLSGTSAAVPGFKRRANRSFSDFSAEMAVSWPHAKKNYQCMLLFCKICPELLFLIKTNIFFVAYVSSVAKRPHCDEFIRFCLEHFVVAVWSSKVSKNVNDLVNMLFGFLRPNLFFVWHQGQCQNLRYTKTGKPIYSKPLKKVWLWWQDYSLNNTLLIDDSQEKTSMNPEGNVLCPPTYFYDYNSPDNSLGGCGLLIDYRCPDGEFRKYLKGLAKAESVPEYSKNTSFGLTR